MDNRLKEIVDNFDRLKVGVDEPFKFHCTQCGKCCINREDILLNPKDLFNIAKELNLTIMDAFGEYCEMYIGGDSRFPIVRLVPKGEIKRCPLLKDKKCSVHKVKPTVCALFPLGRVITFDAKQDVIKTLTPGCINFIFTPPGCGDESETHTVREWLEEFDIPIEDKYYLAWNNVLSEIAHFLRIAEKRFLSERFERIFLTVFALLYLAYDTQQEFSQQFERNIKKLAEIIKHHGYKGKLLND